MGAASDVAPALERWFVEPSTQSYWSPYSSGAKTVGRRLDLNTRLETFQWGSNHVRTGPLSSNSQTRSSTECDEVLHTAVMFESINFFRKESVKVLEEALPFASANTRSCVIDGLDKCPSPHVPGSYGKLKEPLRHDLPKETKRGYADPNLTAIEKTHGQTPAKRVKTSITEEDIPYLSCPFVKHNGDRYDKVYNSCTQRPGFSDTKRLSTHLFRVHCGCLCCRKTFDNTKQLQEHRLKAECKNIQEQEDQPELMTEEQEKIFLRRFDKGTTATEKYRGWYQVLWPEDPRGPTVDPRYDYLIRNCHPAIYDSCKDPETRHSTQDRSKQVVPSVTMDARLDEEVDLNPPVGNMKATPAVTMAAYDEVNAEVNAEETAAVRQNDATLLHPRDSGSKIRKKLSEKKLSETSLPSLCSSDFMSMWNYSTEDSFCAANLVPLYTSSLVPLKSTHAAERSSAAVDDTSIQPDLLTYGSGLVQDDESEYIGMRYGLDLAEDNDSEYIYMRF